MSVSLSNWRYSIKYMWLAAILFGFTVLNFGSELRIFNSKIAISASAHLLLAILGILYGWWVILHFILSSDSWKDLLSILKDRLSAKAQYASEDDRSQLDSQQPGGSDKKLADDTISSVSFEIFWREAVLFISLRTFHLLLANAYLLQAAATVHKGIFDAPSTNAFSYIFVVMSSWLGSFNILSKYVFTSVPFITFTDDPISIALQVVLAIGFGLLLSGALEEIFRLGIRQKELEPGLHRIQIVKALVALSEAKVTRTGLLSGETPPET